MIRIQANPYPEEGDERFVIMCELHDEADTAPDYEEARELADNPELFCEDCKWEDRVSV